MNIFELSTKSKAAPDKAGTYPIYTDEDGMLHVYLMVPSDPKYGGSTKQLGKGMIDPGENPLKAAEREANEELGLLPANIEKTEHVTTDKRTIGKRKDTYLMHVYVTHIKQHDAFDPPGYESGWAGWVDIDTAIEITRSDQTKYLEMVKDKYGDPDLTEAIDVEKVKAEIERKLKKAEDLKDPNAAKYYQPHSKEMSDLKAQASFLQSQLDLLNKQIEPLEQPDDKYQSIKEWQQEIAPAVARIKQDCQPYLQAIRGDLQGYPIFRGLQGTNSMVMTGRVRLDDRRPAGMEQEQHDLLNMYFTERYGEPYRNALFVSGDANFAKDYGNLYLIFPREEFSFLWSPDVRDLYFIDSYIQDAIDDDKEEGEYDHKQFIRYMDKCNYMDSWFTRAVQSNNEIMIRCESYYGINLTEFFGRDDYVDDSKGNQKAINTAIQLIEELL